jgi:hypothetical protein
LLVLEVLYLLGEHWEVLLGRKSVDAIEEHSPVVVRYQEAVPALKELLFQVVHNISSYRKRRCCLGA